MCCPRWPCGSGRPRSTSLCPCTTAPENYHDEDDNEYDDGDGDDADDKAGNNAEDRAGDDAENDNDDDDGNDNDIIIMLSPCTTELSRIEQDDDMEDQTTEGELLNRDFYKTGGK